MGHRVSVYLPDELHAAWKASGLPLGEAVRRGLDVAPRVPAQVVEAAEVLHRYVTRTARASESPQDAPAPPATRSPAPRPPRPPIPPPATPVAQYEEPMVQHIHDAAHYDAERGTYACGCDPEG